MKTLMLSTALVTASAFGAIAQEAAETAAPDGDAQGMVPAFLVTDFTGMSLYTLDSEDARTLRDGTADDMSAADRDRMRWTSSDTFVSQRDSWEDVGSINDVVMTQDGEFRGILIDVGGFLGLGARTVMVDFEDLYFVSDDADAGMAMDDTAATDTGATGTTGTTGTADTTTADAEPEELSDFFVVIAMSEEELESLPEWDESQLEAGFEMQDYSAGAGSAGMESDAEMETETAETGDMETDPNADSETVVTGETETDPNAADAEMVESDTAETETESASGSAGDAPAVFTEDYAMLDAEERTADRLIGAEVFDSTGESIGNVNDVVLDGDQVSGILVDVGGFLGMGEHTVNLPLDQADIGWSEGSDEVRVQVSMSAEELEAMPEHEG